MPQFENPPLHARSSSFRAGFVRATSARANAICFVPLLANETPPSQSLSIALGIGLTARASKIVFTASLAKCQLAMRGPTSFVVELPYLPIPKLYIHRKTFMKLKR